METSQLTVSHPHVILTRQTCGHRLDMAAGSKRRGLAFYFPIQIWYMFLISKYRGKSDLGLCMSLGRANRMLLRSADFPRNLRPNTFSNRKFALRSRILFARTEVMHTPRFDSPLHFDIRQISSKNKMLALAFASSRHARALAAGLPRQDHF